MINFLNIDEFCKGLKPVTSTSIANSAGEFDQLGLYSEIIFGTIGSVSRKTTYSFINLNANVVHPTALKLLIQLNRKIEKLISTESTFIVDKNGELIEDENGFTGIEYFKKIFLKIKFRGDTPERENIIKVLEKAYNTNRLFINKVPVIPPDFRPAHMNENTKEWTIDNIVKFYTKILRQSLSMKSSGKSGALYDLLNYGLQKAVIDHDEYIRTKIGKKSGLIRSQLMGKRIDFSGRAVITPGPNLKVYEVGIPFKMAVDLFYPFLIHILLYTNKIDRLKLDEEMVNYVGTPASVTDIQKVIKSIKHGDKIPEELYKIIYEATDMAMFDRAVILKRDPVLHQESVRGFKPILIEGNTIKLSTLMTGGFSADFDGDAMAIFHPLSKEAQDEIKTKMVRGTGPTNSTSITFDFSKEMRVGLYILSKDYNSNKAPIRPTLEDLEKATDPSVPVIYKNKTTTMGKAIINNCLPPDFRFVDEVLNDKSASNLIVEILVSNGQDEAYKSASKLKDYSFKFATISAPTFSLDEIQMPPKMYELKAKLEKATTEEAISILAEMKTLMIKTLEGSGLSDLIESGSTKGWDQPMQMLAAKGLIADTNGNILPVIKGSFSDGLTTKEFFSAAEGARKGIIDRVLNTADTGYTSRQLVYLLNSVEVSYNLNDCKTTNTLEIKLSDDIIKRLSGRFIVNNNGTVELFNKSKNKSGDIINLRTPIYCKSLKICHTCYGKLLERVKSPYVGIVAAQIIGERGTQLTMRTFHTGGAVKLGVKGILNNILENDPYIKREILETYLNQVESNLIATKKCKLILSFEDYSIGDNIFIDEENGSIIVKSLISIIEFEDGVKFNLILDYPVDIKVMDEFKKDDKNIIIPFDDNDKILEVPLSREDIKGQVLYLGRLLGGRELYKDINHLFLKLYKNYSQMSNMDLVHLEILLSQCLRDKDNPMIPARVGKHPHEPVMANIKTNVFNTGFLNGLCFENVSKAIKTGLLQDKQLEPSVLERVLLGTIVEEKKET